jgi:hypothetical protein
MKAEQDRKREEKEKPMVRLPIPQIHNTSPRVTSCTEAPSYACPPFLLHLWRFTDNFWWHSQAAYEPIVSSILNIIISVSIVLYNKRIFQVLRFPAPVTLR